MPLAKPRDEPSGRAADFFGKLYGGFKTIHRQMQALGESKNGKQQAAKRPSQRVRKFIGWRRQFYVEQEHLEKEALRDWRFLIFNPYHHGHLLTRRIGGVSQALDMFLRSGDEAFLKEALVHARHSTAVSLAFRKLFDGSAKPKNVDLPQLLTQVGESFSQSHFDHAAMRVHKPRAKLVAMIDPELAYLAFYNLFRNAVNAAEENPRIAVSFSRRNGSNVVTITDNGSGLGEYHSRILSMPLDELFAENASSIRRKKIPCAGIGILSTRRIVEDAGGKLIIKKTGPSGTAFEVELPAGKQTTAKRAP